MVERYSILGENIETPPQYTKPRPKRLKPPSLKPAHSIPPRSDAAAGAKRWRRCQWRWGRKSRSRLVSDLRPVAVHVPTSPTPHTHQSNTRTHHTAEGSEVIWGFLASLGQKDCVHATVRTSHSY